MIDKLGITSNEYEKFIEKIPRKIQGVEFKKNNAYTA